MKIGRDLGTYYVRVEFMDGSGFFLKWETCGRWLPNHPWRADCTTLDSWWQPPAWESEDDLASTAVYMFLDGSYSCDCNRRAFLAYAIDEDNPHAECGDTLILKRLDLFRPDGTCRILMEPPS